MALKGNLLYAQSGGPSPVINSSAYGVLDEALNSDSVGKVFIGNNGIEGIIKGDIEELTYKEKQDLLLLTQTPGAAFGSCRHMLPELISDRSEYEAIKEVFEENNIRYFLYNGGNDSMDTVSKLASYFKKIKFDCSVIGIPKTIDNDLEVTDHTPGYGSAAKYIATSFGEIACDASAYIKGRANVVEIMGRDTGWLTCAASLARLTGYGPDLIYVPEAAFSREKFVNSVKRIMSLKERCFIAVSEGVKDKYGSFIAESAKKDAFGHAQLGGVAANLSALLENSNIKTRAIELNLAQRACAHLASKTDIEEAIQVGREGVKDAIKGLSGFMVTIVRTSIKPYLVGYGLTPAEKVAGQIKYVPDVFLNPEENDISEAYFAYALPLIQGERKYKTSNGLISFFRH